MLNTPNQTPDALEQVETLTELLRGGKDEMNLAEFPMTSLSDKPITSETSLKFEDQIYDDRQKKLILRKRIIEGSKEYGLPTATDDSVLLALIQITKQRNGFSAREVDFSRHELIQLLRWPNKGQSYKRIAMSLHRLAGVTYHFDNSWWDNRRKRWTTKIFGIIDNVDLNDSRESGEQGGLFASRILWNQNILDSFQSGYLRTLDFQLAISFKHAISMRIYRFMGKRFHLRQEWTFKLKEFAQEHVGIGRSYEGGAQIARKLRPAIAELENAGFLEPLAECDRYIKSGRDWTIRLVQRPPALPALAEEEPAIPEIESPLVTELVNRGVTTASAADLVRRHPADLINVKLDVFDWMVSTSDKRVAKSPAGYLVKSINDDYANPKGFVSRAEAAALTDRQRLAEVEEAEKRSRTARLAATERAEKQAVQRYRKALNEPELAAHEAIALAETDPQTRQTYQETHDPRIKRMLLGSITDDHIHRLLQKEVELT